jgi:hypothetical protein
MLKRILRRNEFRADEFCGHAWYLAFLLDLVSENLARVAATAEQILGVLNKDSGLMVEFTKRT